MKDKRDCLLHRFWKYWGIFACKVLLVVLGIAAALTLWESIWKSERAMEDMFQNFPYYILVLGLFGSFCGVIAEVRNQTAVAVSFGSTRREAFWGQQFSTLLRTVGIIVLYTIAELVCVRFAKGTALFQPTELIFWFGLLIGVAGITQMFTSIAIRIGGKAGIILISLCGGVGGCAAGFFIGSFIDGIEQIYVAGLKIPLLVLGISMAGYILGCSVNYINLRKYAVKG